MKSIIIFLGFLYLNQPLHSFDSNVSISITPLTIGTAETAEIVVSIENESVSNIPKLSKESSEFSIKYLGESSQRQATMINGSINMKTITSYIFEYRPKTTGEIKIPAFVITTKKNDTLYSSTSKIKVENTKFINNTKKNNQNQLNPFGMFFDSPGEVFLEWSISKEKINQNTGFLAGIYLFSENPNFLEQKTPLKEEIRPRFDGGVLHKIELPKDNDMIIKRFGPNIFYGKMIQNYIGFPLDAGELILHAPLFINTLGPFSSYIQGKPVRIISTPITKTLSYIGDKISISADLSSDKMDISKEHTLTLIIKGDGNTDFFANPFHNLSLKNIFISAPTTSIEFNIPNNSDNITMTKTFSYKLIPRKEGLYTIPSIKLNYRTKKGILKDIATKPISFEVINTEIRSSESKYAKYPENEKMFYFSSGIEYILISLAVSIIVIILSYIRTKKKQQLAKDRNYNYAQGTKKRLHKIIKESKEAIQKKNYKEAAQLLRQSILHFCTDKFLLSKSSSPQEILKYFETKNILLQNKDDFLKLLIDLEFSAFGIEPKSEKILEYLNKSHEILKQLDKIKVK